MKRVGRDVHLLPMRVPNVLNFLNVAMGDGRVIPRLVRLYPPEYQASIAGPSEGRELEAARKC